MERRAHWSDDLIDAVRDAVDVEFEQVRALVDAADGFTPPLTLTTAELRRALGDMR